MVIIGSPDITSLQVTATWDISGTVPIISIINNSSGTGLANVIWWFIAKSPSSTIIHEGSALTPDETGNWTTAVITDNWPRPFNSIEWSGAPYTLLVYAQDSAGNVYFIEKSATICRPSGNGPSSKNPYGLASVDLKVLCQQARIWFEDITSHSYKGMEGTRLSSVLRVIYPIDETGTIPDPFILADFSTALVPITYSSDNYQFLFTTTYQYDLGDSTYVRIKYQSKSSTGAFAVSFPVLCNIDLMPLVCEYTKLINEVEYGNCADVVEANRKLGLINSKMMLVQIGMQQPLTGIDVPPLIKEIEAIGGFSCDCCNAPTGIIPITSSVVDGYNFEIVPVCGDITGEVEVNGANIQFKLSDKSYVFDIYPESPAEITAFTVEPQTDGCTKTYYLRVDGVQLATDILTIISGNAGLVNLFNSIVTGGGGSSSPLIVDGGCIFDSTSTCDYEFTIANVPVNTTYALLYYIQIGGVNITVSFAFNLTNLAALQTYLNGLGYGTFVVTNPSGQNVLISTVNNALDLGGITYKISGTAYNAAMSRECTGYVPIDPNVAVQNIINYLCNINTAQVVTSQDYTISYVDTEGVIQYVQINEGTTLSSLLQSIIDYNTQTIANGGASAQVDCDSVKSVFAVNNLPITATDFIAATKGNGACSRVGFLDAFQYMLTAGMTNATIAALFYDFVLAGSAGLVCAPYNYFDVIVTNYSSTCAEIVGVDYSLT